MANKDELKPCPFCGSNDLSPCMRNGMYPALNCGGCETYFQFPLTDSDDHTEETLKLWNTRVAIEDKQNGTPE